MEPILVVFLSFLSGSIPFGFIVGKLKGVDVRNYGSGNIGATNVSRVLGKKYGALVLLLDALKGTLPVILAGKFQVLAGVSAILGHCFSPFLKFRGGKGVATSLGAFLVISPKATLLAFLIFVLVFVLTRYVSLSSITAAVSYPFLFAYFKGFDWVFFSLVCFAALVVVLKHHSNIKRLLRGEERKFK